MIDKDFLSVESGGAVFDIDGDGYPDVVFGSDYSGRRPLVVEESRPAVRSAEAVETLYDQERGRAQHHDQIFGDFKGTGKPQLVYWSQEKKQLFIADIPPHPTEVAEWPATEIYAGPAGENPGMYPTGLGAADIESNGRTDLLAGNIWFKYLGHNKFKPIHIGQVGGRIAAAHLIKGSKYPQIVLSSGDCTGPLMWFECKGDPEKSTDWVGHDLVGRNMLRGHSLAIADIDGDGNLDIFTAEMVTAFNKTNPNAEAFIFFGDGKGHFRKTVFAKGVDFHDAHVTDLTGEGRMDIVDLPYTWNVAAHRCLAATARRAPQRRLGRPPLKQPADHAPRSARLGSKCIACAGVAEHDMPAALARTHAMGFTDVEVSRLYGHSAAEVRRMLDENGLTCSSIHTSYEDLGGKLDAVARDAKTLGASMSSWHGFRTPGHSPKVRHARRSPISIAGAKRSKNRACTSATTRMVTNSSPPARRARSST